MDRLSANHPTFGFSPTGVCLSAACHRIFRYHPRLMPESGPHIVICDGDLPGLVACALAARDHEGEDPSVAWFVPVGDATDEARRRSVLAGASALGLEVVEAPTPRAGSPAEIQTQMLLTCAHEAIRRRIARIIWGVHIGGAARDDWPDLDDLAAMIDRALLCARLASLDAPRIGPSGVRIETPIIDLTDRQLAELAQDLGVPVECCWWMRDESEAAQRVRNRWKGLLETVSGSPTG